MSSFLLGMVAGAAFATLGSLLAHRKQNRQITRLVGHCIRARAEAKQLATVVRFWRDLALEAGAVDPFPRTMGGKTTAAGVYDVSSEEL